MAINQTVHASYFRFSQIRICNVTSLVFFSPGFSIYMVSPGCRTKMENKFLSMLINSIKLQCPSGSCVFGLEVFFLRVRIPWYGNIIDKFKSLFHRTKKNGSFSCGRPTTCGVHTTQNYHFFKVAPKLIRQLLRSKINIFFDIPK